ncbi:MULTISPECIES: hypothetical protein [unclassified Rickettsia]|uniref:hypothetical protein n=1 Tax=unclassified Rickettsia TaxID=114295 RepID=UPI0031334659
MSFPRRRESRKIIVSLNLFQDIFVIDAANLFSMTKKSLDSRFHGNDIKNSSHATMPPRNDGIFCNN